MGVVGDGPATIDLKTLLAFNTNYLSQQVAVIQAGERRSKFCQRNLWPGWRLGVSELNPVLNPVLGKLGKFRSRQNNTGDVTLKGWGTTCMVFGFALQRSAAAARSGHLIATWETNSKYRELPRILLPRRDT